MEFIWLGSNETEINLSKENDCEMEYDDNEENSKISDDEGPSYSDDFAHTTENENKFPCSFCSSSFTFKTHLNTHMKTIHRPIHSLEKVDNSIMKDEISKVCDIKDDCESMLKLQGFDPNHAAETKLNCSKCGKVFRSSHLLIKHVALRHTNPQNLKCPLCSQTFKTGVLIKVHIIKHFIDNPFRCDYCELSFPLRSQLNKHTKLKHCSKAGKEESFEHLFECRVCNKAGKDKCLIFSIYPRYLYLYSIHIYFT